MFVMLESRINYTKTIVSADELFGVSTVYNINIGAVSLGYTESLGKWLFVERAVDDNSSQCVFIPLTKTLSDSRPVYCEKFYKGGQFNGFIYFRGHERPFCSQAMIRNCLRLEEIRHG